MASRESTSTIDAVRALYTAMGRFDRMVAEHLCIHVTDLHCIDLVQKAPCSGRTIAAALGLTPSAVTTVLDRLEDGGFVERRPSSTDRRRIEVHLTDSGHRRAARAYKELGRRVGKLEQRQSSAQRKASVHVLLGLSQACEEAADAVRGLPGA